MNKKIINLALGLVLVAMPASAMEKKQEIKGNKDVNTLTDMVIKLTDKVRDMSDESAELESEIDSNDLEKLIQKIKDLDKPLQEIKDFIEEAIKNDSGFKNKLNDEGMPPFIIAQELELYIRHDLHAIRMTLGLGMFDERSRAIHDLTNIGIDIDNMVDNMSGPLIRFKNLKKRYDNYLEFIQEDKRYTGQEAHVLLHIAIYAIQIKEALVLAKKDGGRHLLNVLKTYVELLSEWMPHIDQDVEVTKAHGSLLSATDKNGKTQLSWTNELRKKAKAMLQELSKNKQSSSFMVEAIKQFDEIARILKKGLAIDEETGELKKVKGRELDRPEKKKELDEQGLPVYKAPIRYKTKALDIATEKENIDYGDEGLSDEVRRGTREYQKSLIKRSRNELNEDIESKKKLKKIYENEDKE